MNGATLSQLIVAAWCLAYLAVCIVLTRSQRRVFQFAGWFLAGMLAGVLMLSIAAVVFHALTAGGAL